MQSINDLYMSGHHQVLHTDPWPDFIRPDPAKLVDQVTRFRICLTYCLNVVRPSVTVTAAFVVRLLKQPDDEFHSQWEVYADFKRCLFSCCAWMLSTTAWVAGDAQRLACWYVGDLSEQVGYIVWSMNDLWTRHSVICQSCYQIEVYHCACIWSNTWKLTNTPSIFLSVY